MKNLSFWMPSIVGALATPVFILTALISTGAGHGSYTSLLVFYPAPLLLLFLNSEGSNHGWLLTIIDNIVIASAVVSALLQFPIYGFIVSYSQLKTRSLFLTACKWAALLHFGISIVWLPIALFTRQ